MTRRAVVRGVGHHLPERVVPNSWFEDKVDTSDESGKPLFTNRFSLFLRGEGVFPMPFGLTASSRTFGGLGAGSTMFLVDPKRELVFVCLTAGLLEESRNFERLQRLSDLVLSAVVD